jgi:Pregnancy-associated plasma protein-A
MRATRVAGPWRSAALTILLTALAAMLLTAYADPATSGTKVMMRAAHQSCPVTRSAPAGYQARDRETPPSNVRGGGGEPLVKTASITVRVYVHVLRTASTGGVPRARIEHQLNVLDNAFAGNESTQATTVPFRFVLAGVTITRNNAWFRMNQGSGAEAHAKHALHRGGPEDLNFYIGGNSGGLLGWGTQPTRVNSEPKMDGVVIARHTMPGGKGGRYSAGDTAVHETGHWLGLYHTYTGKCSRQGDRVADTPREARPAYECPMRRNTCAAPGHDPIHNFMDAGTDACMNQFTKGQASRMVDSWNRFRAKSRR